MIWIPNSSEQQGTSIVSHIQDVIYETCGDALQLDGGQSAELAEAVASFVSDYQDSGAYVDSGYLVMLASRALSSLGQQHAAHRLVVFGTGLVRPSEWEVTGGEEVWTLDLRQMTVRDDAALELVFFNSLNIVMGSIVDVWDKSEGHGVLGLRHVSSTASALLSGGKPRDIDLLANEIRRTCEAKLEQVREERKWSYLPTVMDLDL